MPVDYPHAWQRTLSYVRWAERKEKAPVRLYDDFAGEAPEQFIFFLLEPVRLRRV
jgi:hypothetical protein